MLFQPFRLAFRSLRRRPGFSALAIATIAIGAGTNAAVSAVAYGVLLKPLPFADPGRVVAVWPGRFMSQADLRYLRGHARGLSQIAAVNPGWRFSLTGAGDPTRILVDRVSGNLFETLGARPSLGRVSRSDEDNPGAPSVLVLSHHYWQSRFGADPSIVGRTVRLDDRPYEIVGVMPASFEILTTTADAWAPLPADPSAFYDKLNFALLAGRLAPGVSLAQADADFKAALAEMRRALGYPAAFGRTARLEDLRAATTGDMRSSLLVLAAAVGFMLLIAGANLGTLLVARGVSRAREFAVHAAIGASRARIVGLQLAEGVILAIAGAAAGLALAAWSLPALVAILPRDTPRVGEIHVDTAVSAAVLAAALLVALFFAAFPSVAAGRRTSATALREGASTESRATRRTRGVMVAFEIALALVLAIGAGLMARTLWHLQGVDAGIDIDRLLTLQAQASTNTYKGAAMIAYYDRVLERIAAVPGVASAGAIQHLPLSGTGWILNFDVELHPTPAGEPQPTAGYKIVMGDYFRTIGQRLLAGRVFTTVDRRDNADTIIVNDVFARRYFGGAPAALGTRMHTGRPGGDWQTIVGVVSDVRTQGLDKPAEPEFYTPVSATIPPLMIAVRTDGDPVAIAPAVREAVWSIDRSVPISDLQPMRTMVGATLARPRLLLTLLGAFAITGLTLGAIGIYGVVAFAVTRRRREIGIRMALGATRPSVVRLMIRESAGYALGGLVAGTGLAVASSRLLKGLLFEVPAVDPATYATLALGVAALVVLASYWPARRAAALNPAEALRAAID